MKTYIKSITHLLFVLIVNSSLLILSIPSFATSESKLLKVTLESVNARSDANKFSRLGFDVLHGSIRANSFDIVVSKKELLELKKHQITMTTMIEGQPLHQKVKMNDASRDVPNGYFDLAEINQRMIDIAKAFPNIVQLVNITQNYNQPTTFEGRDLFALKISDNVNQNEDEPSILIVSNHHAREIITPVIAFNAIEQLTSGYGIDTQITAAINQNEIWIAPNWNPDGYNQVIVGDNFWRKNRRVFPNGIGVDLNRNYPQGWDAPCGGSTVVTSQTYRGPSGASEPETQTMMAWSADQQFAKVIDYHSFGREVLYAYSCSSHPFSDYFMDQAIELSEASGYLGDNRPAGAEGEHYQWQLANFGSWSHLIETALEFQPTFSSAQNEANTVWPGILHAIERPIPLTGTITDEWSGEPLAAEIKLLNVNFSEGEVNYSDATHGRYYIFAPPGFYQIEVSLPPDYIPVFTDFVITEEGGQTLDFQISTTIDDKDGDGVPPSIDNCVLVPNANQIDTDADGYGNKCDADFNNDCITNFLDLAIFSDGFLGTDPNLDTNSDGDVNFLDLVTLTSQFLNAPGPSAFDDLCSPP